MDKKALRQARARILQERSRVLEPLQKRVNDLEARIVTLEAEVKTTMEALEKASATGDAHAIAQLSKKTGQLRQEIDGRFNELESAASAMDRAGDDFTKQLNELG